MNGPCQIQAHDKENTAQYSSVNGEEPNQPFEGPASINPFDSVGNAATGVYDFVNTHNPLPTISDYASDAYNDLKQAYSEANAKVSNYHFKNDHPHNHLDNSQWKNFSELNTGTNQPDFSNLPIANQGTANKKALNATIIVIIVLLVIIVVWHYWKKRKE